ncbi:MAG: tetratricopeptide repeat protein [Planctomycetes bacterium]|nr:tetratricopeptide repeat protein [Planctomycetota bacterium]
MHAETAYLFRHAVLRDAAYQLQLPGDRANLHALAIESIEFLTPSPAQRETWAAELADHAALAQQHAPANAALAAKELDYLERGAASLARHHHYEDALKLYARLAAHPLATDEGRVRALLDASKFALRSGAITQARALAEQALAHAAPLGESVTARALAARGGCLHLLGEQEAALNDFESALAVARQIGDAQFELECAVNCGAVMRNLGRHEECRALCEWSAEKARSSNKPEIEGYALQTLANLHRELGEFEAAIRAYDASLRALDTAGNRLRAAQTLGQIGGLHMVRGDAAMGAEFTRKSLEIAQEIHARRQQASMQIQLAACMHELGQPATSIDATWQALQISRETGDLGGQALALCELCSLYADNGNRDAAQRCVEELERMLVLLKEKPVRCHAHGKLGYWHWKQGRFDLAEREYNKALETPRMTGDPGREAVWKSMVAMVKARTGRVVEAEAEIREALQVLRALGQAHNVGVVLDGWAAARREAGLPVWIEDPPRESP